MPRLTRLFVKTALVYLVLALLMGFLTTLRVEELLPPGTGPVYIHLLVIGWLTQLIAGVAYWMFPKFSRARPRGHDGLMWAAFALLNVGLLLRAISEPALVADGRPAWGWLLIAAALSLWLGGVFLVAGIWPRVKER